MAARKAKQFGSGIPQGVPHMELNIYQETFKVRGSMSGVRLLHVMDSMDGNKDDERSITEVIEQFLSDALLTEDRERGMDFLENSDPPIDLTMLLEIIRWLIEQYTANPTQSSAPSENGSESDGSGSSENAPQPASTSGNSTDNSSSPSQQSSQLVQS